MASTTSSPMTTVLGIAALSDLVVGIALSLIGLSQDMQVLSIVGVALLLSGGGLLAWVIWARNRPESI